jgi:tRNA pseudouridine55 synthase
VIEKEAKAIEIHSLELNGYDPLTTRLALTVSCSRGTYIRVLAADIGRKIGCGAHLTALRRTRCGGFTVEEAVDGAQLFSGSPDALAILRAKMQTVEQALAQT